MPVNKLGYVALQVTDLAAWKELATDVFGFEVDDDGPASVTFRLDDRLYRYRLQQGVHDALQAVGWEVADSDSLERLIGKLRKHGVDVETASAQECADRHVEGLARFADPSNFPCEIFFGAQTTAKPLQPRRKTSGFKTGELGLGHIVLAADDHAASVKFYREILGFKVSDTATIGPLELTFLRCNPRHHSVAFSGPRPNLASRISHVMVETNTLEDVGLAYDICLNKKLPMRMSLGQHTNDRVVSFYVQAPSGFAFEYGFGGIEIDDHRWEIEHWTSGSIWGHRLGG